MQIEEFALATWLNEHETDIKYNLAASTGPLWTVDELMALEGRTAGDLGDVPLNYVHAAGTRELRGAIADFYGGGVDPEAVLVTTGAAEALWLILFDVCVRNANVIVPRPCYPAFDAIPRALGTEVRYWHHRRENGFRPDLDELKQLVDRDTRAILVNTPHNPTGYVMEPDDLRAVAALAAGRGIRLIADEVYHGIFYDGLPRPSAVSIPTAIVTGDVSKAFSLAGLRIGWIIERDDFRRHAYYNLRSYICVSSGVIGERLAALAIRHHDTIWQRNTQRAAANLALLEKLFDELGDDIGWVRPRGGFTCFPWLKNQPDSEALCRRLADESGVLLAPGYTFAMPQHFRVGFGVAGTRFSEALGQVAGVLKSARATGDRPPGPRPFVDRSLI